MKNRLLKTISIYLLSLLYDFFKGRKFDTLKMIRGYLNYIDILYGCTQPLATSIAFVRPNAACFGIAPLKPRA